MRGGEETQTEYSLWAGPLNIPFASKKLSTETAELSKWPSWVDFQALKQNLGSVPWASDSKQAWYTSAGCRGACCLYCPCTQAPRFSDKRGPIGDTWWVLKNSARITLYREPCWCECSKNAAINAHLHTTGLETKRRAAPASCSIDKMHPSPLQNSDDFLNTQTPPPQKQTHFYFYLFI